MTRIWAAIADPERHNISKTYKSWFQPHVTQNCTGYLQRRIAVQTKVLMIDLLSTTDFEIFVAILPPCHH